MSKKKKNTNNRRATKQPALAATPAKRAWYTNTKLVAGLLVLLSLLLYAQTLTYGFALDDSIVITDNFLTQQGISGWGELFTYDTFYGFFQDESKAQLVSGGRYRPLSLAVFSIEAMLSDGPFLHHFFNLVWYGGLVAMIYFFLLEIQRHRRGEGSHWTYLLPLIATAIFAAHPLHTEVVANIKGRDEIMALMGSVGAAWLIWRAVEKSSWKHALLASLVFFLGLLSKENTITFLAVIPVMLYALRRDFKWSQLKFIGPAIGTTVVFLAIRQAVIGGGSGQEILELMNNPFVKLEGGRWVAFSFAEWSATVVYGLGKYLQLMLFPVSLSHDYYPRAVEIMGWGNWQVILSLIANIALLGAGFLLLKKRPWLAAGILVFFLTLSVVSNVLFPIGTNISERFLFFPSLGFGLVVAFLLRHFFAPEVGREGRLQSSKVNAAEQTSSGRSSQQETGNVKMILGVLAAMVLLYTIRTVTRNPAWENNYTLFTTDVKIQPRSAKLQNAAAGSKIDRYQDLPEASKASRKNLLSEAVNHLNQALQIHPTYKNAFLLRGNANLLLDNYEKAIADYDKALELDPGYGDAQRNLLIALQQGGRYYGEKENNLVKANATLQRALSMDANSYETLRLLGVLNGVSGNNAQALTYFQRALEQKPNDADAIWNVATAYFMNGQEALGQQFIERAKQIDPGIEARKRGGG